ncbi:MAG TPA: SRPBCC domain-containing protein [Rhizomicrobium sp.]|nr:SRPBCC domain-containing protein [Rhizomicrobium sp.]
MVDILHKIGITAPASDVYKALTTNEGLSAWWTHGTSGENTEGGIVRFRFGERGGFDMKVLELQPGKEVLWQVVDGPEEWIGTKISFDLRQEGDWTLVFFKHRNWKEPSEFMHHCSTKWGVFLLSLKSLLETGKGSPYPDDLKIDSWE